MVHICEDLALNATLDEVVVDERGGSILKGNEAGETRADPGLVERGEGRGEEGLGEGVEGGVEPGGAMTGLASGEGVEGALGLWSGRVLGVGEGFGEVLAGGGDGDAGSAESGAERLAVEGDERGGLDRIRCVAGAALVGVAVGEGAVGDRVRLGEKLPGADGVPIQRTRSRNLDELAEELKSFPALVLLLVGDDRVGRGEGFGTERVR
jgi:hypothetical protein